MLVMGSKYSSHGLVMLRPLPYAVGVGASEHQALLWQVCA